MNKKKILIVFGTRPEAIKMAPLVIKLKNNKNFETFVCVTGQHRELLDQVLEIFDLKPDYDLDIMRPNQSLNTITALILEKMEQVLICLQPDLMLVHGDTTTSFAASLSAFHRGIKVCHVEAGLRTNNKSSPWPEEVNRQLTARIASHHFAPTKINKQNLISEGIDCNLIHVTGNTVVDAADMIKKRIEKDDILKNSLATKFKINNDRQKFILFTGHRRENFGDRFERILQTIKKISRIYNIRVIYPMHLNPNVKEAAVRVLRDVREVDLIEPVNYVEMVYLMTRSTLIITDSGGIQEEAPFFDVPVLVTRINTERPEGLTAGSCVLVGTNETDIINGVEKVLHLRTNASLKLSPYGDGKASARIEKAVERILGLE